MAKGATRLSLKIDRHAKLALKRLAACCRVTRSAMVERLILGAETTLLSQLTGQEQNAYYDEMFKIR